MMKEKIIFEVVRSEKLQNPADLYRLNQPITGRITTHSKTKMYNKSGHYIIMTVWSNPLKGEDQEIAPTTKYTNLESNVPFLFPLKRFKMCRLFVVHNNKTYKGFLSIEQIDNGIWTGMLSGALQEVDGIE